MRSYRVARDEEQRGGMAMKKGGSDSEKGNDSPREMG